MDDSGYLNFYAERASNGSVRAPSAITGEIARMQVTVPVSVPVFDWIEYRDHEVSCRLRDVA